MLAWMASLSSPSLTAPHRKRPITPTAVSAVIAITTMISASDISCKGYSRRVPRPQPETVGWAHAGRTLGTGMPGRRGRSRLRIRSTLVVAALSAATLFGCLPASGSAQSSSWTLGIVLHAKVASNHFDGTVVHRYSGLATRIGERVTLRISRSSRCRRRAGGRSSVIRCGSLGSLVAASHDLDVIVTGEFETGHLGAIGFVARTLIVEP